MTINTGIDPWDYLDGTAYPYAINAGAANGSLATFYVFLQNLGLGISVVLIMSSIVCLIYTTNATQRMEHKQAVVKRLKAMFLIGIATSLLSILMTICNMIFGIS